MNNKKAFTLIELLAVIIILGVLMLVAIPSVTNYINNSRKEGYINTARQISKGAVNLVNSGNIDVFDTDTTYYIPISCIPTENAKTSPYGNFEETYIVVTYDNEKFDYYWVGTDSTNIGIKELTGINELTTKKLEAGVKKTDIDLTKTVGTRTKVAVLDDTCSVFNEGGTPGGSTGGGGQTTYPCTYTGELTQGAEYTEGQFTYRYMQEPWYNNWDDMTLDGWGMRLTDKNSTDPVTTQMCSSINGKPILSMQYTFYNSKTTSIDLTKLYTVNVQNFQGTFKSMSNVESLDMNLINTSNATNMLTMFENNNKVVNICGLNTSKVKDMTEMFGFVTYDNLDISCFNTSNLETISQMFYGAKINNLNLSNWNNPRLNDMKRTFIKFKGNVNLTNFKTENVTDFSSTFAETTMEVLDISSFSSRSATSAGGMFQNAKFKTIYATDNFDLTDLFPVGATSSSVFIMTYDLVGGNGTNCRDTSKDYYARVDKPGRPGCFTLKN